MAQNVNPTFVKTPNRGLTLISTGTGQGLVTLYTGGANGSKIVSVNATTTSTTALDVQMYITNLGNNYYLGTTNVAALAGTKSSVNAVALLNTTAIPGLPVDSDGNPYLILASSADTLTLTSGATVPTTGGLIFASAVGGDF